MIYLCIGIILMVIVNNCKCVYTEETFLVPQMNYLESQINERANNGYKISNNERDVFFKPEKNGKIGTAKCTLVWKCTYIDEKVVNSNNRTSNNQNHTNTNLNESTNSERLIAVRFKYNVTISLLDFDPGTIAYTALHAFKNETVEDYGILTLYFNCFVFEKYHAIGLTLCDALITDKKYKTGRYMSELNLLCAFYQAMFSIKFLHEHALLHNDIKTNNFMVRGNRLFLIDLNSSKQLSSIYRNSGGNPWYGSISYLLGKNNFWIDELKSLFYTLLEMAGVDMPWHNKLRIIFAGRNYLEMIIKDKLNYDAIGKLIKKVKSSYMIFRRVLSSFYEKIMLRTDPKHPELVKIDPRIPPYNEIGEEILNGIEELTENKTRDVLFKWKKGEKSTNKTIATSKWIIDTYNSLTGGKYSQLCDEERQRLEKAGLISTAQQ